MDSFYSQLTPFFHLIYNNWGSTIENHGDMLEQIFEQEWGNFPIRNVLDVACGIGTQSLGLAARGFEVTASDLSAAVVERARQEARIRNLSIDFSVCDMREVNTHHGKKFDAVICAGNSLPHLLNDEDIYRALDAMYQSLEPGGGCIITMRQYDNEERGTGLLKPFGVRDTEDARYIIFQVWDFDGEHYKFAMYFIEEKKQTGEVSTHVMRSDYYAISPDKVLALMEQSGFEKVRRLDDGVQHPAIIVGTRGK